MSGGKSEEFWQTLQRVVDTVYSVQKQHCESLKLPWNAHKAQRSAQEMYRRMWEFKFLPPGRGLWAFDPILIKEKGSGALNNCCFVSSEDIATSFSAPFTFAMDMLMLGVGVGFDANGSNKVIIKRPKTTDEVFKVEDSREGWNKIVETVLESFVGKAVFPLTIDYADIRPEGSVIKTFGGIASGPGPLAALVNDIVSVFNGSFYSDKYKAPFLGKNCIQKFSEEDLKISNQSITSTHIVDLFNTIGRCVVSGNVRRSAELALGEVDDLDFSKLKQDIPKLTYSRWASNNSLKCEVGMDYTNFAKDTAVNGEPGYVWLNNARTYGRMKDSPNGKDLRVMGFNPCAEQTLESFELCCLVEVFPTNHDDYEDFEKTLKYAYLYAKTVTLIPTHDTRANAVMMRNRRIGTSLSGIVQAFERFGKRTFFSWCDNGYKYLKSLDELYSDWLCVPRSIKISTVKPSGTVSLLPGVTPGIHYPHSEYHIRNIRVADSSPLVQPCRDAGYVVEKDVSVPNTVVISFPVHEKYYSRGKEDVSMWEQLENAAQMQHYWSDNAVSVTVSFRKEEASGIKAALELYETRLKSVSFLPLENHGYEQAPYIAIDEKTYDKMAENLKVLRLKDSVHEDYEKYCDTESCVI